MGPGAVALHYFISCELMQVYSPYEILFEKQRLILHLPFFAFHQTLKGNIRLETTCGRKSQSKLKPSCQFPSPSLGKSYPRNRPWRPIGL
jgi:hypothetical protein